ncbi:MAG: Si-specific NAD(P)(+) transhydrogenase [Acidobacteriota bacterium]
MTEANGTAADYDLIVLGSGPAGEKGAAQAAYFGKRVALVEREPVVGGACVNTGTIPSKTLRETALHLAGLIQRNIGGVEISLRRDVSVLDFMRQKDDVVARQHTQIESNIQRHGIDYYRGAARFKSADTISIESAKGTELLRGRVILIATGSSPHQPAGIPFDHQKIYDSDTILTIDCIPQSLAVVGAGVIGCEYASIFAALGVKVSLIDGRTELLGHIDDEISDILLDQLSRRLKIELHLGADVASIEPDEDSVNLTLTDGRVIDAQKVLYAAGRQSNTGDLDLAAAGVVTGKRGLIPVNEHYQTNVTTIYAAGDVIGFPALASTSMEQARVAVVHAFDLKYKQSVATLLPFGIYTIPEVATIGRSEEDCQKAGIDYEVGRAWFRNNPRGMIIGETDGLLKIVFDPESRQIFGVHIVGENASDLLHIGMMVMQLGGTLSSFIDSVFNYPTLGDAYKYAAYDGLGNLARRGNAKSREA